MDDTVGFNPGVKPWGSRLGRLYNLIDLVTGRITQGADPPDKQEVLSRLIETSDHAA